jgi:hypothetical protein
MGLYAETLKVLPVLIPADIVATSDTVYTEFVDLSNILWGEFLVHIGTWTNAAGGLLTLECSTAASSGSEVVMGFDYRLSAAIATDTMGAITAGTSDGVAIAAADDGKVFVIEVDPAAVAAKLADARYVRVGVLPSSDNTVSIVGAVFVGVPRYAGNSIPSAT